MGDGFLAEDDVRATLTIQPARAARACWSLAKALRSPAIVGRGRTTQDSEAGGWTVALGAKK